MPVINPADPDDVVGHVVAATAEDVTAAIGMAVESNWALTPVATRAELLRKTADLYEANTAELFALLGREAGKSWADAVAEVREAVDFLRYYADQAETADLGAPRGVFAAISPWNFPLAIFTGQIAAALAAGNAVVAKPAPQTPLIAFRAVKLMHEAGIAADAIQLVPGGPEVGTALTSDKRIAGVAFTGSLPTAHRIDRAMAAHLDPSAPLIAETGGLNAMIVDSTALPEQAVRDILASAFQSAGQRCSALRILYVQDDAAERTITMLKGAMDELVVGNPWLLSSDVGPIIDAAARQKIETYVEDRAEKLIHRIKVPNAGHFVAPTVLRVSGIEEMPEEIFGPVLHVATFKAEAIDAVVDAINASGYGLTFGMHTRISSRVKKLSASVHSGNLYINRNQIGAVVGSQPFGGEGLSGTGPKAGGPHYLPRFATADTRLQAEALTLPGPTGESNVLHVAPRGRLLCLGPSEADIATQRRMAEQAGCTALVQPLNNGVLALAKTFDAVAWFGAEDTLVGVRKLLAERDGPILPLLTREGDIGRLQLERHVCIDTTAAGGNASLMAQAG